MIEPALQFIASSLDQFIKNRFGLNESAAIVNKIVEFDDTEPLENKNKVVITLINIEHQTVKPFNVTSKRVSNGQYEYIAPAQRFNLDLMLSANFDDYSEGLKFLNAGILFFQINPVLSAINFANFPKGLDKLELDVEQITYNEMHNLWSAMGAKYRPSLIYKTRLLTFQGNEVERFDTSISSVSVIKTIS